MTFIRTFIITTLLFCCALPIFAQDTFPTVDAFLKATLGESDQLSTSAKGDLNSDGVDDWVGVVRGQPPDESPTYQLFVLLKTPQGSYSLAQKSLKEEIPGMGCCWLEDLTIRRGSIYVQNNAKTAATMEAATHQFKLHKGEWRLVGLRIYLTDHTPTAPMTHDTDMNLMTGLVIEKIQKGERRPTSSRRTRKFPASFLKDFDFSNGFGTE